MLKHSGAMQPPAVTEHPGVMKHLGVMQPQAEKQPGAMKHSGGMQPPLMKQPGVMKRLGVMQPLVMINVSGCSSRRLMRKSLVLVRAMSEQKGVATQTGG